MNRLSLAFGAGLLVGWVGATSPAHAQWAVDSRTNGTTNNPLYEPAPGGRYRWYPIYQSVPLPSEVDMAYRRSGALPSEVEMNRRAVGPLAPYGDISYIPAQSPLQAAYRMAPAPVYGPAYVRPTRIPEANWSPPVAARGVGVVGAPPATPLDPRALPSGQIVAQPMQTGTSVRTGESFTVGNDSALLAAARQRAAAKAREAEREAQPPATQPTTAPTTLPSTQPATRPARDVN